MQWGFTKGSRQIYMWHVVDTSSKVSLFAELLRNQELVPLMNGHAIEAAAILDVSDCITVVRSPDVIPP
jgi:hypothetical protein